MSHKKQPLNLDDEETLYKHLQERAYSYSRLKHFLRSPEHFLWNLKNRKEPTKAMMAGSLIDVLVLTPEEEDKYFIAPQKPPYKKDLIAEHGKEKGTQMYEENKLAYQKILEDNADRIPVTKEEMDEAKHIAEKVNKNPAAKDILSRITSTQHELRWKDPATKLNMVSFLDGKGDDIILELKTTRDADPKKFYRDCLTYDYHMQAGIYVEGIRCREFKFPDHYFIAVEKEAPFGISVLKSDAGFIKYGQKMYRRAMDMMKYCIEKREFESSYEFHSITGYHNLELPYYMTKELDDE